MAKKTYIHPQLTVVTFRNEKGYATSPFQLYGNVELLNRRGGGGYEEVESFDEHDSWRSDNQSAFWD